MNQPVKLGPREKQVLAAYVAGLSYNEIAAQMEIRPSTVTEYLKRIRLAYINAGRTFSASRAELIRLASEDDLNEQLTAYKQHMADELRALMDSLDAKVNYAQIYNALHNLWKECTE